MFKEQWHILTRFGGAVTLVSVHDYLDLAHKCYIPVQTYLFSPPLAQQYDAPLPKVNKHGCISARLYPSLGSP